MQKYWRNYNLSIVLALLFSYRMGRTDVRRMGRLQFGTGRSQPAGTMVRARWVRLRMARSHT